MGAASDKIQPRELNELPDYYKRSQGVSVGQDFKKKHTLTDVVFLLFLALFLFVLLFLLAYCVYNGDIYRTINGYDSCGNVCGSRITYRPEEQRTDQCYYKPQISEPYNIVLKFNNTIMRACISDCTLYPGYRKFFRACLPLNNTRTIHSYLSKTGLKNFFQEVSEDFNSCWNEFLYLCLIALAFSISILVLFRYLVGVVVWLVLLGVSLCCSVGTVVLWIMWDQSRTRSHEFEDEKPGTFLAFASAATVVTFLILLLIIVMRKRIRLVVQLFKEAGKAMASMPLLLFQPILTFVCLVCVVFLWFYFCLWIESSGFLVRKHPNEYQYEKDFVMKFTRWYNILAALWMCQFVIGCQHMVIAGAVVQWYFARNKSNIRGPIGRSAANLIRYHLGSVALGSFLIALVQLARVFFKAMETYLNRHHGNKVADWAWRCCQCCLYCFEKVLKYLNRNAYIEIALHGYSFCKASQQAFKILVSNALRVTAINSVGDFVLFLGKVFVVATTVLIGTKLFQNKEGVQHIWVPITLAGLIAYFISHCFMTVYEMAIDTIFICFCEDCVMNDGVSRPYFMSRGLMEFVENSKRALHILDMEQTQVRTISASVAKQHA